MKAFRIKQKTSDGLLQFDVPREFYNKELEVIVLSVNDTEDNLIHEPNSVERSVRLNSYFKTVQYPDKSVNEDDVYYQ